MRIPIFTVSALLAASIAKAGIPVSIIANVQGGIEHVEVMGQWAAEFEKWQQQIEQAKKVADFAKQLKETAGDPEKSLALFKDTPELDGLLADLGSYKTDDAANVDAGAYLESEGSSFYIGADGKEYYRDPTLYGDVASGQGALGGARGAIGKGGKTMDQILADAEAARKRGKGGGATQADLTRMQIELQTAQLKATAAAARTAAASADADLLAKQKELKDKAAVTKATEAAVAAGAQAGEAEYNEQVRVAAAGRAKMKPVELGANAQTNWFSVYGVTEPAPRQAAPAQ